MHPHSDGANTVPIVLWHSLSALCSESTTTDSTGSNEISSSVVEEFKRYVNCKYIIHVSTRAIFVCFESSAQPEDHAKTLFESILLQSHCAENINIQLSADERNQCRTMTDTYFVLFWSQLKECSWKCDQMRLQPRDARVYRKTSGTSEDNKKKGKRI